MKDFALHPFQPPKYKCHTQAVERAVKLVTEAASSVVGEEARDGFIRATKSCRMGRNSIRMPLYQDYLIDFYFLVKKDQ